MENQQLDGLLEQHRPSCRNVEGFNDRENIVEVGAWEFEGLGHGQKCVVKRLREWSSSSGIVVFWNGCRVVELT